jgi:hypothetical protein
MKSVKPLLKTDTSELVYFVYFYSVMSHGLTLWGNSETPKEYASSKRI